MRISDWSSDVCSSDLLFTVVPGQETGIPASNADIRATLRLSSPAWFAQPRMTSSMDERSSAAFRSISARRGIAARSSARMCASSPLYRPIGVRTASQITASTIMLPSDQDSSERKSVGEGKVLAVRLRFGVLGVNKKKKVKRNEKN